MEHFLNVELKSLLLSRSSHRASRLCSLLNQELLTYSEHTIQSHRAMCPRSVSFMAPILAVRYLGVIRFAFRIPQLLLIRFT